MRDQNGEIIRLYADVALLPKYENMTPADIDKETKTFSQKQLKAIAPVYTLGVAIKQVLSKIPVENNNELAMKVFKFIDRINNMLEHNEGKWNTDSEEIKKLQYILSNVKGSQTPIIMGQILVILEEHSAELVLKNKKV